MGMVGIEKTLEPILKILAKEIEDKIYCDDLEKLFHGEISEEEYWEKVIAKNNWDVDTKLLKKTVRDNFAIIDGTREIIEELKRAGYKLGLLSIHAKEWIDHCEKKFDYHKLFDTIMYSFQVGVSKPQKEAFELILSEMKASPEETLFIDNSLNNTEAAKMLNINTILFKNPQQLRHELKNLNIKI